MQVLGRLGELLARAEDEADGVHGVDGVRVSPQRMLVRGDRLVEVAQKLSKAP